MCYAEINFKGIYNIAVTQRTEFSKVHWNYSEQYDKNTKFAEIKEKIESFFNNNTVQENLFYFCLGLESVTIKEGISKIEKNAFSGCSSLTQVKLPQSLKSINEHAFSNTAIEFLELPKDLETIEKNAFSRSKLKRISIPNVGIINSSTFFGCSNLEEVQLADGITNLDTLSFFNCDKLININLPETIKKIGEFAFAECNSLEEITIPNSVLFIGTCAFQNCKSLKRILYKGKVYTDKEQFNKMLKDNGLTSMNNDRIWM